MLARNIHQEKNEKIDYAPIETNSFQKSFSKQVNLSLKNKLKSTYFLLQLRSLVVKYEMLLMGL